MRQYFPSFFTSYGSDEGPHTPALSHSGGRFAKFSKDRDVKESIPLSSIENGKEGGVEEGRYGQSKDVGIVVPKGFNMDSSKLKSTNTSTEDLVVTPSRKYSLA
jgi:hypothetical protein